MRHFCATYPLKETASSWPVFSSRSAMITSAPYYMRVARKHGTFNMISLILPWNFLLAVLPILFAPPIKALELKHQSGLKIQIATCDYHSLPFQILEHFLIDGYGRHAGRLDVVT